jgi:hypothetical protein
MMAAPTNKSTGIAIFSSLMRRVDCGIERGDAGRFSHDRQEQSAAFDLPADRHIPGFAAAQLALVEPDFDAAGA